MRVRLFAVGAALAAVMSAQEAAAPVATDWDKEVDRACTSTRLGLRLAASKKVAEAGDTAVPAIRRFAAKNGVNAVPVALVEAEADKGGNGEPVVSLLIDWAKDRDFYWRAQALRGLWLRSADRVIAARCEELFGSLMSDPAWLVRAYAYDGYLRSCSVDNPDILFDPLDPRGETKLAVLQGRQVNLLDALGDERTFLGDPWGKRRGQEAFAALKQWAGNDCGYKPDAPYADNAAAIAAFAKLVQERWKIGAPPAVPHLTDPDTPFAGGVEILSCKNGDFFLRWRADGELVFGLVSTGEQNVRVKESSWRALSQERATLTLPAQSGVVVCDKLRLKWSEPDLHAAIAPGSLPVPTAEWLKHLAQAIEEAGAKDQAAALRQRLDQFLPR